MNYVILFSLLFACSLGAPLGEDDDYVRNVSFVEPVVDAGFQDEFLNCEDDLMGDSRIIGGADANIRNFPWMLSLRNGNTHVCGASIISATRGLTAAHCLAPNDQYNVLAGSTTRQGDPGSIIVNVQRFIIHPHWSRATINNDIAVLWFAQALPFRNTIRPARVPVQNAPPPYGTNALVSGWGSTRYVSRSDILQFISVPLITNQQCQQLHTNFRILPGMLCMAIVDGRSPCSADSGSPMVANGIQLGIMSFGTGCGRYGVPTGFTRVAAYTNWIRSVV